MSIEFKSKLDDYKTEAVEITIDGVDECAEVRSSYTREFRNAQAEFFAKLSHVKEKGLEMTVKVPAKNELGEEYTKIEDAPFIKEMWSTFASKIIVGWDTEDRRKQLFGAGEFCVYVRDIALQLGQEFADKKKT